MRLTTISTITGLALAALAQAGEEAAGKAVIAPAPAPVCDWSWFGGGSVGYVTGDAIESELDDWDEPIYTLHLGLERKCPGDNCSHAFFLEVGYTEHDDSLRKPGEVAAQESPASEGPPEGDTIRIDIDMEIIPITLNYKYECLLSDKLNWYAGAGAGIALFDSEGTETTTVGSESISSDDTVFYAQIFAGLVYNISDSLELFGGVRYIFMDDPEDGGVSIDAPLDGAVQYELGGRINF